MDAIKKSQGPCVILAGAGTGKTRAIVEKVKYFIENKVYKPEKIVCITFSNEAANNLLSRVRKLLPDNSAEPVIKTFHSFSAALLREHADKLKLNKKFHTLTPEDAKILLHANLKVTINNCHKYIDSIGQAKDLGLELNRLKEVLSKKQQNREIEDIKHDLESLQLELPTLMKEREKKKICIEKIESLREIIELHKFIQTWNAYEKIKEKQDYLDYSDLTNYALRLLKEFPEISKEFHYVIVDEFQDTNKVQLDILKYLAPHRNITVVGDINQSIYRFRGAYEENLNQFKKDFTVKPEEIFTINRSYRSPNKVLKAAHDLIRNNYANPEDCFLVENAFGKEGEKIKVYELKNEKEEARKIIELIESEISKGKKPEDICIMARTHQQLRIVKLALAEKQIPFYAIGKASLLKQKSVKMVINYLTILNKLSKKEKNGFEEWWALIHEHNFSREDLIKIGEFIKEQKESENPNVSIFTSLEKLPLSEEGIKTARVLIEKIKILLPEIQKPITVLMERIYNLVGLTDDITSKDQQESILNIGKLEELAKSFSERNDPSISSFLNYLSSVLLLNIHIEAAEIESSGVRLMTSHATKGLEFGTIILTNFADKRFPIERIRNNPLIPKELLALSDDSNEIEAYERQNQMFEERRLAYVSFTRAKENLIITYADSYNSKKTSASQFLAELNYKESSLISFEQDLEEKFQNFGLSKPMPQIDTFNIDKFMSEKKVRHFSPSALLLFEDCQKKFEYRYVYNMPEKEPASWESIKLGSFVHTVLEKGVNDRFVTEKEFLDFAKDLQSQEEWESVDLVEASFLIKVFFQRNKDKYSSSSKTEQYLKTNLSGLEFIGIADRIDFHNGEIEIVDYKTGKSALTPKQRTWQLGYYAIAAERLGKVRKLTLDMLRHDKPLEFVLDSTGFAKATNSDRMSFSIPEVKEELVQAAKRIQAAFSEGFQPCPIEKNCEFCNEYIYFKV